MSTKKPIWAGFLLYFYLIILPVKIIKFSFIIFTSLNIILLL